MLWRTWSYDLFLRNGLRLKALGQKVTHWCVKRARCLCRRDAHAHGYTFTPFLHHVWAAHHATPASEVCDTQEPNASQLTEAAPGRPPRGLHNTTKTNTIERSTGQRHINDSDHPSNGSTTRNATEESNTAAAEGGPTTLHRPPMRTAARSISL